MTRRWLILAVVAAAAGALGCGSTETLPQDAGPEIGQGFGPPLPYVDAGSPDATWKMTDGGYVVPEAGVVPADRFITHVVSFKRGPCSGFGLEEYPGNIEGPPKGGGTRAGSLDVVSLGNGGEITVSFAPNAIVDGPGPDFIVFENPFYYGDPRRLYAEPAEVSVSEDGAAWHTYPCTQTTQDPPYGQCAGVHPVFSSPDSGISPFNAKHAGGDAYDLADLGVSKARFVRIVDKVIEPCPDGSGENTNGFDLDAIAVVNAEYP